VRPGGVEFLTLFAFSFGELAPAGREVSMLKQVFIMALEREAEKLHRNGIRLARGGRSRALRKKIGELVARAELLTRDNTGMTLTIAANYGGRWTCCRRCTV